MKVLNKGSATIKFIADSRSVELHKGESTEIDPKTYSVLSKLFSSLVVVEEEPVIIKAKPAPIEKKEEKKPAKKKSKGKK